MSHASERRRLVGQGLVLLAATVCLPAVAAAHTASVTAVKAAFLYNFAKFTEWPEDVLPADARLELCVAGDVPVADALEQTIRGRRIEGHELAVRVLADAQSASGCHMLYMPAVDATKLARRLQDVRTHPILSVSDDLQFVRHGGVIQLRLENERMLFTVNVNAADRARLRLSSKLLSLARIHREAAQ